MIRQPILLELLVQSAIVAALHYLAITFSWYWTFWWMDIVMHFLGGTVVGLGVLWLVFVSGSVTVGFTPHERFIGLYIALGGALVVGLGWELFELYAKIPNEKDLFVDTVIDFIMDALGGMAAYGYVVKKRILGDHGWD